MRTQVKPATRSSPQSDKDANSSCDTPTSIVIIYHVGAFDSDKMRSSSIVEHHRREVNALVKHKNLQQFGSIQKLDTVVGI